MQDKLTYPQWCDWLQYREQRGPIGTLREDFRAESNKQRFTKAYFGGDEEGPNFCWPYWDTKDAAEIIESVMNSDEDLVPNGKGGYEWRQR